VKTLAGFLVVLIAALQYPLWAGKGGWMRVRELERTLEQQRETNARLKARNDAIEERARLELGMIKRDETFYQLVKP
jgi:cell division protein FtsB